VSLLGILSMGVGALEAQQSGLETTANNLANINTPGYCRQRPVLQEADPVLQGGVARGNGVRIEGIQSLRDAILDLQITDESQEQGKAQAFTDAMNQLQPLFPSDASGIGSEISGFFASLNNLSTNPSDLSLRQNVLAAAKSLTSAFNSAASQLSSVRGSLDQNAQQAVGEVNQLTQEIAGINAKLASLGEGAQDAGSFLDQRSSLIQQLSSLIDVSVTSSGNSLTLTSKQGVPLVVDGQSFNLTAALDPASGVQHLYSQGNDVTTQISGGQLGGILAARDQTLPSQQAALDSLAAGLVKALNAAHHLGFDLNGQAGGDLFTPVSGAGSAAGMALAFSDPRLLAASSDATSGSNGNLANLSAVASQPISNGMTPQQAYSDLVFQVGSAASDGKTELNASQAMLQQLQQQQAAVSGVSLDEEASNLLLYQRAYQAAAQSITAVDQMLQTVINMGAGG